MHSILVIPYYRWILIRKNAKFVDITFGNNITNIPEDLFDGYKQLSSIHIDNTNQVYRSIDGVLFNKNGDEIIRFPEGKGAEYIIPYDVKQINEESFENCQKNIFHWNPSSVNNIGSNEFKECTNLTFDEFCGIPIKRINIKFNIVPTQQITNYKYRRFVLF